LYDNSLDAVKEQLSRDVDKYPNCRLQGADLTELMDEFDDSSFDLDYFVSELEPDLFELENYESYPAINVEMLERDE
jgi:thymidylate synthase